MAKYKSIYTFAVSRDEGKTYILIENEFRKNEFRIPTFKTPEEARNDAKMYLAKNKFYENSKSISPLIIDIGLLVERGIIPKERLFGSGVRE